MINVKEIDYNFMKQGGKEVGKHGTYIKYLINRVVYIVGTLCKI